MASYRDAVSLEDRKLESQRLLLKYPGHVAVVVKQVGKETKVHLLALPGDATVAELEATAAELLGVPGTKLALSVSGFTPASSTLLEDLYRHCKCADGFLYVRCGLVGTLGASAHIPCFGTSIIKEDFWWSPVPAKIEN
ncbi:ATG8/AUT7/APG8/PAZ2 putative (ATG8B.2) [Leptomonas pyrrhocoris]|uniref:ATG8/AUT7/APG8/PAZ2 putative (ATG8B.2) n=1 Tax=Leptomonas pyrrhocoris TaxID=157538 RepID=A0A0M9G5V4_LEPPY|nr:ATG8/AUT7/APG8/PAZ2 putative (ATG8B.2) [Leptomonas pyrrhocoris]KPA82806.1 ATG8/AUT7/APG8/PAZ2 putative (ATG8B.2) [Leptomonas pyrrhocoris]|eukprot:XP_015661245.1 ATG8/AUT7/APG8/PAZ2 putative (ATG8B.2) [Leptomonas pyrrhocoris]